MPKIIHQGKVSVISWAGDIDEGTLKQATRLADLSFAFKHIALMPDCHSGYGMPIGGVLATKNIVIPNAVGVDIGCGMVAVKTSLKELSQKNLHGIIKEIKTRIPVGFNKHDSPKDVSLLPQLEKNLPIANQELEIARYQIGTLGGGNHFIEIQKGNDGHIWFMIHSGSRRLGYQVAKHYNNEAVELNKYTDPYVPKNYQLAYLPTEYHQAKDYLQEMQYCIDYAFANRKEMSRQVKISIQKYVKADFFSPINIAHNYAAKEKHFEEEVIVHRKGATSARKGEKGIIPGSQGTKSYIVEGKGNPESFMSCSHGAGRKLSRTAAKKKLDLKSEIKKMNERGILHGITKNKHLDEAPSAYKNIDTVMKNQEDLVSILVELQPLAVIKG